MSKSCLREIDLRRPDQIRVLVTGSRGKSSVVRLLHAALNGSGIETYARITGAVPRELGPEKERTILRSSGAHVEEMRWWLKRLSPTKGIVLENSAIAPELQGLAGHWLKPQMTVLTNTIPDHQEVWGPTSACAAKVLTTGIPKGSQVIIPSLLKTETLLLDLLKSRCCQVYFAEPLSEMGDDWRSNNMALAYAVINLLGLGKDTALQAMHNLKPDRFDFHVANFCGAKVATAFTANDIMSTKMLFRSLRWNKEETRLVYNHRSDRCGRLNSFANWLNNRRWREVLIIGDKPQMSLGKARYLDVKNETELLNLFNPGELIFGCGNVAGLPLALSTVMDK